MKKITEILAINETGTEADIYIDGYIGWMASWQHDDPTGIVTTSNDLKAELKALQKINPDISKINLHINSPGGSVAHALAMYNILDNHKASKFVYYTGNSASAATVIAAVAPKENIYLPEYLSILVHEARTENYGTAKSMSQIAEDLIKVNHSIALIYSNLNGLSIDENLAIMGENNGEGRLLTPDEAVDLGFIGNIQKINSKIAALDLSMLGWSDYHINKLNKFYSQLNFTEMGLNGIFKQKIQNVESENQTDPKTEVENVGYTGEVVMEEVTLKIENGLIIDVVANEVAPVTPEPASESTNETNQEIENLKSEIENLKNQNSVLQETINEAKLTVSDPKLPVSEFKNEEVKSTTTKSSRQFIYELQAKKREEKLKTN